jgi:glycosyltransferase involved in cell wall biosynthesis
MHFAVNAHLLSPVEGYRQAGVSRYIEQLVAHLVRTSPGERWTVYAPPGAERVLNLPANARLRQSRLPTSRPVVRIAWEQFVAPILLLRDRPAALLCPLNVVPLLARQPSVVTVHDLAFLRYPDRFKASRQRYLATLARLSVRRAAHVVAVSEWTRREVIALLDVPPRKVTTIPNGRDERLGPLPPKQIAAFRRAHDLPERFVLFVGTLEPRKNLPALLRAYAAVRPSLGIPLVVVGGKGWLYDPIFAVVEELGLRDDVRFAGFVPQEDLASWYNAATVLVYPSLYEGFGFPPLEAMQCGTPVITSNTTSLPEVVAKAALTVDPADETALSEALQAIVHDAALRADLRERGLEQARMFSWDRAAQQTRAVLHSVARP